MDFISLTCPNCGGALQVGKNSATFTCTYCGQQHMVREAASATLIEAHARCPICHRNDHTLKVSAIMASGGTKSQYFAPPQRPNPPAAKSLPLQPIAPTGAKDNSGCLLWGGAAFALVMFLGLLSNNSSSTGVLIILLLVSAGVCALGFSQRNKNKVNTTGAQQSYQNSLNQWKLNIDKINIEGAETQRKWDSRWLQAMNVWKKLYYCERDDCVFIPGGNTSAPLSNIIKYVYGESNSPAES